MWLKNKNKKSIRNEIRKAFASNKNEKTLLLHANTCKLKTKWRLPLKQVDFKNNLQ